MLQFSHVSSLNFLHRSRHIFRRAFGQKRSGIILAASLFIALAMPSLARAQSFANGGFETGDHTGWTVWPSGASVINNNPQAGAYCAELSSSTGPVVVQRNLDLAPGVNATISGYAKAVNAINGAKAQIDLVITDVNQVSTTVNIGMLNGTGTLFKQFTINQFIPLGTASTTLKLSLTGPGTVDFDSFSVDYTTGHQLIQNRGFEGAPDLTGWLAGTGCTVTTTSAHGGAQAAMIAQGPGPRVLKQDFPMAANQKFTVRGFLKTVNLGNFAATITVRFLGTTGATIGNDLQVASAIGTTDYASTPSALTLIAPVGTMSAELRLTANGGSSSTGSAIFDDLSVVETGANATKTVGNPGGPANYNTIQAAVTAAGPGDIIEVYPGTYTENVKLIPQTAVSGTAAQGIILRAKYPFSDDAPSLNSIIVAADNSLHTYGINMYKISYWTIDGFDVSGGQDGAIGVIGDLSPTYRPADHIVIQNNRAKPTETAAPGSAKGEDGIKVAQATNIVVQYNAATGVTDQGIDFYGVIIGYLRGNTAYCPVQAGIVIKTGCSDVTVEDNNASCYNGNAIRIGDRSGDNPAYPPVNSSYYPAGYGTTGMQAEVRRIASRRNTVFSNHAIPIVSYGSLDCSSIGDSFTLPLAGAYRILIRDSRKDDGTTKFPSQNSTTDQLKSDCQEMGNPIGTVYLNN